MKLGLMQPYFFPYLGYFDLIYHTDTWIVFDTVQYIRRGWVNRNRILHPKQGWQYVIVPVKSHCRSDTIETIQISNNENWQTRLLGQLQHYKKHAPHFKKVISLVERGIYSETTSLAKLNVNCLCLVCEYLGIEFNYDLFSRMNLSLGSISAPGDWALRISEGLGATEYVNPPGGVDLYDPCKFKKSGVKLNIRCLPPFEYPCDGYEFVPNLSIIDVLMWNTPHQVTNHLQSHDS